MQRLPRVINPTANLLTAAPGLEAKAAGVHPPPPPLSVLVCADEPVWAEGVSRLAASGLPMHRAHGWGEALALARRIDVLELSGRTDFQALFVMHTELAPVAADALV